MHQAKGGRTAREEGGEARGVVDRSHGRRLMALNTSDAVRESLKKVPLVWEQEGIVGVFLQGSFNGVEDSSGLIFQKMGPGEGQMGSK